MLAHLLHWHLCYLLHCNQLTHGYGYGYLYVTQNCIQISVLQYPSHQPTKVEEVQLVAQKLEIVNDE